MIRANTQPFEAAYDGDDRSGGQMPMDVVEDGDAPVMTVDGIPVPGSISTAEQPTDTIAAETIVSMHGVVGKLPTVPMMPLAPGIEGRDPCKS